MIRNTHLNRFVALASLVLVLLVGNVLQAAQFGEVRPEVIEVFTSSDLPITGGAAIAPALSRETSYLKIYNLDGIRLVEAELSTGLTGDPEQAKRVVLQRIKQLDEVGRAKIQCVATGLAKAIQYGINRYPAIVFNRKAVVYGITDLTVALEQYRAWHTGRRP
jgi:integrating conjugative element protein (TIGR03757 family)